MQVDHGLVARLGNRSQLLPARLPGEGGLPLEAQAGEAILRARFLELLDRRQQVEAAARVVASYLRQGHSIRPLIDTLVRAVVREDANFHSFQMVEAGVRQYQEWGSIYRLDDDGNRVYMSDQERASIIERSRESVAELCK